MESSLNLFAIKQLPSSGLAQGWDATLPDNLTPQSSSGIFQENCSPEVTQKFFKQSLAKPHSLRAIINNKL
jgi:hypothetical protein